MNQRVDTSKIGSPEARPRSLKSDATLTHSSSAKFSEQVPTMGVIKIQTLPFRLHTINTYQFMAKLARYVK